MVRAIDTTALGCAEDEATKARYIAALKLVEEKQAELLSSSFKPSSTRTLMQAHHDTWIHKAYEVQAREPRKCRDGALGMMVYGWNIATSAWMELDEAIYRQDGEVVGDAGTLVNQKFAGESTRKQPFSIARTIR